MVPWGWVAVIAWVAFTAGMIFMAIFAASGQDEQYRNERGEFIANTSRDTYRDIPESKDEEFPKAS